MTSGTQLYNMISENMLIQRPSLFVYIKKDKSDEFEKTGIKLDDGKIKSYLKRVPEYSTNYSEFLETHYPVRLSILKLNRCKNQKVTLVPVNIDTDKTMFNDDDILKISNKYSKYMDSCFEGNIPIDNMPHIEIRCSSGYIPAFCFKVLKTNSSVVSESVISNQLAELTDVINYTKSQIKDLKAKIPRTPQEKESIRKHIQWETGRLMNLLKRLGSAKYTKQMVKKIK